MKDKFSAKVLTKFQNLVKNSLPSRFVYLLNYFINDLNV